MKTTTADTHIEVCCICPNCDSFLDIYDECGDSFEDGPRAENIELVIKCSECNELFIITDIYF